MHADSYPSRRAVPLGCEWLLIAALAAAVAGGCQRPPADELRPAPSPPTPIDVAEEEGKPITGALLSPAEAPVPKARKIQDESTPARKPAPEPAIIPPPRPAPKPAVIPQAEPAANLTPQPAIKPPSTAQPRTEMPLIVPPAAQTPAKQETPAKAELPQSPDKKPVIAKTLAPPKPETLHEPKVLMSAEHAKTCRVPVGATLPEMVVSDLAGEPRSLSSMLGKKLTVVLFWSCGQALGREQFRRLEQETYQPLQSSGVQVIAINVGDRDTVVRELYQSAGGTFPCLLDSSQTAFRTVATAKLPRTYLLGPQGRILWLDIEYSRDMRRELANAIFFNLQ